MTAQAPGVSRVQRATRSARHMSRGYGRAVAFHCRTTRGSTPVSAVMPEAWKSAQAPRRGSLPGPSRTADLANRTIRSQTAIGLAGSAAFTPSVATARVGEGPLAPPFTREHATLREEIREFAMARLRPFVAEWEAAE